MSSEQKKQRYFDSGCAQPQKQCQTETESKVSAFQCVQNSKQDCQLRDNSLEVWSIRTQVSGKILARCVCAKLWSLSPTRVWRTSKLSELNDLKNCTLFLSRHKLCGKAPCFFFFLFSHHSNQRLASLCSVKGSIQTLSAVQALLSGLQHESRHRPVNQCAHLCSQGRYLEKHLL